MHDSPSNSQSLFITETLNYHVCLKSMASQSTYKNWGGGIQIYQSQKKWTDGCGTGMF